MSNVAIYGLVVIAAFTGVWGILPLLAAYVWMGFRYAKPIRAQAVEWTWKDWAGCIALWPALRFVDWMNSQGRP